MNEPEAPQPPSDPPPVSATEPPAEAQPFSATLQGVWERIKHHKIVQWTLAYLAVAYTLLHGAEMLTGSLGWPHGWVRLFTLLLILGVPIVITLAWYHGSRGQQRASGTEIMIIALLLAVGGAVIWRDEGQHHATPSIDADLPTETNGTTDDVVIDDKTIAVLPFVNMSSDKEQEYFSDGLSEELLNLLAKIPELRVAARTSSFYFKGKDVKLPDIAQELRVSHLLEGSVRKSGDRVRITAQLIRGSDGYHEWSETYDRTLDDIFAIQEEIAGSVVSQLKVTLLDAPPKVRRTDPEAYALYLEAVQLDRQLADRFAESIALYERALSIDPSFAPAWQGLAGNYFNEAFSGHRPVDEGMRLAREMSEKSLAIDPKYGLAYSRLGLIAMFYDQDLAAAAQHFERAALLDPANLDILGGASNLLDALGHLDKVVELSEYLVRRDPLDPWNHRSLAISYLMTGRNDDAIASSRAALRLSPEMTGGNAIIGYALFAKQDFQGALEAFKKEPDKAVSLTGQAIALRRLGRNSDSAVALEDLISDYRMTRPLAIASVYADRDQADEAFAWIDVAVKQNDPTLAMINRDPFLSRLHEDKRWLPMLRSLGKAPEQLAAIKFDLMVPRH